VNVAGRSTKFSRLVPAFWAFGLLFGHCTFRARFLLDTANSPGSPSVDNGHIRISASRPNEQADRHFDRGAQLEFANETVDAIIRELERQFDAERSMRSVVTAAVWMSALVIGAVAAAIVTTTMTGIWQGFQLGRLASWRP
jgi:hypothetical protein